MITLMLLAAGVASAQRCEPVSSEQVSSLMQAALLDFATLDEDSFFDTAQQAQSALGCLDEVFLPPNAAAYHRLMGLRAFFDGDEDSAVVAFRASQAIEPDYELSAKIAPVGGKLHRLWIQARQGPNPFIGSFNAPAGKYAYVDGTETRTRAEDLPSIIQYGSGDGSVDWTGYVAPGVTPPVELPEMAPAVAQVEPELEPEVEPEAMPEPELDLEPPPPEPVVSEQPDLSTPPPSRDKNRSERGKGGLVAGTVISGVAAGALYGASAYSRLQFDADPSPEWFWMTNGAYYGSVGCGVLTVTFGSLAIFTGGRR